MKTSIQVAIIVLIIIAIIAFSIIFFKYLLSKSKKEEVLKEPNDEAEINILFLHHSTGRMIWDGGVIEWMEKYNNDHNKSYHLTEQAFPKSSNRWGNYPYDYWNIWVNHAGKDPYKNEPTLEIITEKYDVIVFKHCFPVSKIDENIGDPDVGSDEKRIENYKLQYQELKEKLLSFPDNKFILWTGAALVEGSSNIDEGKRAREFFDWVKEEWDEQDDNIFIWDFFELETEGGHFLKDDYAISKIDSHPNQDFAKEVAPHLCNRIIDVIEGRGDSGNLTGVR